MRIGFIGIGQMGGGMAASLIQAGHEVTVFNRPRAKAEALASSGAKVADSIAQATDGDAVFTMFANDEAVEEVVFREGGILPTLRKGALHISSSTISVDLSNRLEQSHLGEGQRYLAAPVLGRPDRALEGQLFVIVGGASEAIDEARPLFEAIGQRTVEFGNQASKANLVKLSVNFLLATVFESLGEAIALVDRGDIDRGHYLDFLTSTLFGAPAYKTYGPLIAAAKDPPVGFSAMLGLKDIRLALAASESLLVPMPFAHILHERFIELLAQGGAPRDWSAVGRLPLKSRDGETLAAEQGKVH